MGLNDIRYIKRTGCELRANDCGNCEEHCNKIISIIDRETNTGNFDIVLCQKHDLAFTNPYPSEDTASYLYDTKESSDFDVIKGGLIDSIKDFLATRQIKKIAPADCTTVQAVLDYGTGNGRYAVMSAKVFTGARVDAVDYQKEPPPFIKTNIEKVNYLYIDDFSRHVQKYDIIILRHVLEHSHHPVKLISELGERLSRNGILYVEVPNLKSGCAKVFKSYWKGYFVPRHIFHFTVNSLDEVLKLASLEGKINKNNLPMMGNTLALITGTDMANMVNRLFGNLLYPLQLFIEFMYGSSTCLNACLHKRELDR